MDTKQLVQQAESVIRLARVAETLAPAEDATLAFVDSLGAVNPRRKITLTFPHEAAARAFLDAIAGLKPAPNGPAMALTSFSPVTRG